MREKRSDVVDELVALGVVVRVRGGGEALDAVVVVEVADRLERLGVELDRQRRLGHRDVALADAREVDVRVVGDVGREDRLHALEQRAAGVGREAAVAPLALLRVLVGGAVEEAVRVRDLPVGEAEAVEHREPVEPVREPRPPTSSWAGVTRTSAPLSQAGTSPRTGSSLDRRLLVQAREPEPLVRRAASARVP